MAYTVIYADSGRSTRVEHLYSATGRHLETRTLGPGGTAIYVSRREYDASGRPLRVLAGKPGAQAVVEQSFYRDDGSRRSVRLVPPSPGGRGALQRLPAGTQLYRMPDRGGEIQSEYDAAGRALWSALIGRPNGQALGVFALYHGVGAILDEEFSVSLVGLAVPPAEVASPRWPGAEMRSRLRAEAAQRTRYEYDAAGREILLRSEAAGGLLWRELRTEWNQAGGPASTSEDSAAGHRSKTVYAYEYDGYGNWTRKVARSEPADGQAALVSEEERAITYY